MDEDDQFYLGNRRLIGRTSRRLAQLSKCTPQPPLVSDEDAGQSTGKTSYTPLIEKLGTFLSARRISHGLSITAISDKVIPEAATLLVGNENH